MQRRPEVARRTNATRHAEQGPVDHAPLFHALTEHSADAVSVLDARGAILYANSTFTRAFGSGPEMAIGFSALDLIHPDDRPAVAAKFEALVRAPGAVLDIEYRARHIDGTWRTRSTVAQNLLADAAVAGIVVTSRDVTASRQAELELRASEMRYERLVETSHDGICTVDTVGSITYANRRLTQMLGYEATALLGRPIFDFMEPDAAFVARTRFARRQRGISDVGEVPLRRQDGMTLWAREAASPIFSADGTFTGAMFVLGDVTDRRRAEDALRENEQRYRLLFEHNPLPMFVGDVETRRYLAVNEAAIEQYGYTREEFLAMRMDDIRPPTELAALLEHLTSVKGRRGAAAVLHVRKDGSSVDAEVVSDAVIFGDRPARLVMAADVSERRRAEADLRDAHQFMATLVDAAPLAILTTDTRGHVQSWNATAERLFGWTAAEVLGHENPIIPRAQQAEYLQMLREQSDAGSALEALERPALRKDGTLVHVAISTAPLRDAAGTVVGGVALITDITARREAEAALDDARRQLELLLASAGEGIYATDVSGRATFVNPAAARLFGATPESLVGQDMHHVFHHSRADRSAYDLDDCPINASVRDGTVHRVDTDVFWRKDGSSYPVAYVSTPIQEDGRTIGAVVTFQDITKRRELELQLRQSQKMEAIGRLAGGVAHDFNNLLTVITGYAAMLLTELPPEDPALPDLREIQAASDRGAGLTRQLLAFSRQQVLEPRVIDLQRIVGNMENMLRRLIGEDIDLLLAPGTATTHVHADRGQVEQVIMNLVVNARDAMPSGGRLAIEVADVPLTAVDAERFPYVIPGEYVRLCVRDTGCGMDEATQSRVFDPFFTTKEVGKGTGLGLATVYGIVKQSGGYIWMDSAPGAGTAFRIYLPRVTEEPDVQVAEVQPVADPDRRGLTVLVAEDEDALRAIVERVLTKQGYTVLSASTGAEALAIAERLDGLIDLLVTDVVMPTMSGPELADIIVQRHGDVPILFVTGYSMEAVANHGVLRPGSLLLNKPFTPQALALAASELLRPHAEGSRAAERRASDGGTG